MAHSCNTIDPQKNTLEILAHSCNTTDPQKNTLEILAHSCNTTDPHICCTEELDDTNESIPANK